MADVDLAFLCDFNSDGMAVLSQRNQINVKYG